MCKLKREFEEEEFACGNGNNKLIPIGIRNDSTSCGDGLVIPKETTVGAITIIMEITQRETE